MKDFFRRLSQKTSQIVGSPAAFIIAFLLLVLWALSGPVFHFSDTWRFMINTFPTIITFLLVFLIQNTQNRDTKALHLKLDELIRSIHGARNTLVNLQDLSDEELEQIQKQFKLMSQRYSETSNRVGEVAEIASIQEEIEKDKTEE
jgi:low affinity Fe/Cu permease